MRSGLDKSRPRWMNRISTILSCALLIFACMALFLPLSRNLVGGLTLGLSFGALSFQFLGGNFKNRKIDLISFTLFSSILLAFGTLHFGNILTASQMAYGIIGLYGISIIFYCGLLRGCARKSLIES